MTDKEAADFNMLYSNNYVQERLFLQELDKQKRATVVSSVNIDKTSYDKLKEYLKKKDELKEMLGEYPNRFAITKVDYQPNSIDCYITYQIAYVAESSDRNVLKGNVGNITISMNWNAGVIRKNNYLSIGYPSRFTIYSTEEVSALKQMNSYIIDSRAIALTK